ncbi:MAG TPA: TetR/AcrR family transcriptional regulator [Rhodoglobus sp.]|nr:TetR/AcrR family transcriptional regulator [Rhodoglobus sp.]
MAAQTLEPRSETWIPLRNEPVQARSTARLTTLLDAAAAIVDEIGFERLTTAMVAERAGASIGTVYRYFPDRIALLQALGARNLERTLSRVSDEIGDPRHENWLDALTAAFGIMVDAFRTEPGFRGLRVGDVIDLRPALNDRTFNSVVADALLDRLIARFGIEDGPQLRFKFEAAIEVSDALATRAFARDPQGDERFLVEGREVVYRMLADYLGDVRS